MKVSIKKDFWTVKTPEHWRQKYVDQAWLYSFLFLIISIVMIMDKHYILLILTGGTFLNNTIKWIWFNKTKNK